MLSNGYAMRARDDAHPWWTNPDRHKRNDMGRVILIRHGRTFSNAQHILDTRPPGAELTEIGKTQADDAGLQLAQLSDNLGGIFCSVAIRAQQTALRIRTAYAQARAIATESIPLEVMPGLHEIFVGDYEGRNDQDAHMAYGNTARQWMSGVNQVRLPGGESAQDLVERYQPIMEMAAERTGDHVLVVHGGAMRIAGLYASDIDPHHAQKTYMSNCGFIVLEPSGEFGKWHCSHWVTPLHSA
ncbi:histidine phosphatase family protein [Corynebacterium sp. sy017]|nr:histidine phosphatase family protein [Corynebacterium sp. sy017]